MSLGGRGAAAIPGGLCWLSWLVARLVAHLWQVTQPMDGWLYLNLFSHRRRECHSHKQRQRKAFLGSWQGAAPRSRAEQ